MKKLGLILLCTVLAAGFAFAGGGSDSGSSSGSGPIKIGVAIPSADHGWTGGVVYLVNKKVESVKAQYGNQFDIRVVLAASTSEQVQQVESLIQWGMKYLVILPHEAAPLHAVMKQSHDQGIRIIAIDRGIDPDNFGCIYMAADNSQMGTLSGQWLAKTMVAQGLTDYIPIGGMPIPIDVERMTGFFGEMEKQSGLTNLLGGRKYEYSNFQAAPALQLCQTYFQQYPKIDAIFCQDDDAMIGVLQAIKEANRTDIKIVFGGAGAKYALEMIKNGDPLVSADALYPPGVGADGIQYAIDVALGNKPDDFHNKSSSVPVKTPSALIDKSNVDQYYDANSPF
jgi:ribose transport system substrate-binding protein